MADGRAVVRSSLREFVASEAMAALGVPTTRALALVATGDRVLRDMFYKCALPAAPAAPAVTVMWFLHSRDGNHGCTVLAQKPP